MTSPSSRNKLRHFQDLDDLFDNNDNEVIMGWCNELNEKKITQREQGKSYRLRQQAFAEIAKRMLDGDEVKAVKANPKGGLPQ